jgi:mannitol/fructose-specific phosphotransferase system IIA component (Ntr-type)
MGAKRLSMSMVVLRHPVPFGHEFHDPVRLALACSSIDYGPHIRAVGEAIDMLRDEGKRNAILAASSREEILASVKCMVE